MTLLLTEPARKKWYLSPCFFCILCFGFIQHYLFQLRRKLVTTSKNLDLVRDDMLRRKISSGIFAKCHIFNRLIPLLPILTLIFLLFEAKDRNEKPNNGQNALLKEILYDHRQVSPLLPHFVQVLKVYLNIGMASQLNDTILKSDQMMAVVKDLFGDYPMVRHHY